MVRYRKPLWLDGDDPGPESTAYLQKIHMLSDLGDQLPSCLAAMVRRPRSPDNITWNLTYTWRTADPDKRRWLREAFAEDGGRPGTNRFAMRMLMPLCRITRYLHPAYEPCSLGEGLLKRRGCLLPIPGIIARCSISGSPVTSRCGCGGVRRSSPLTAGDWPC